MFLKGIWFDSDEISVSPIVEKQICQENDVSINPHLKTNRFLSGVNGDVY